MPWVRRTSILLVVLVLLAAAGFFIYKRLQSPASSGQRTLTRLTFDSGLQIGATWSPDGRFVAYSSNRGGKFDIWGAEGQRRRSGADNQGARLQLAAGLVA